MRGPSSNLRPWFHKGFILENVLNGDVFSQSVSCSKKNKKQKPLLINRKHNGKGLGYDGVRICKAENIVIIINFRLLAFIQIEWKIV